METSPANTTTGQFIITLVLLSKRGSFLSPRPRLPIQLSFHWHELGVDPSGLIKSGAHLPVYVVRAAPFRVQNEPGTFFRHLPVSRVLMTDRQIIDVLENTDGLMVATEDEKARGRSRDCEYGKME